MSRFLRRFEVLLPARFNDGQAVPDELLAETILDIREEFGVVSAETQPIQGIWQHQEQVYRDDLRRVFVDAEDISESRMFFVAYKEKLKERIWISTYPIEII